jgi:hypothetical protein
MARRLSKSSTERSRLHRARAAAGDAFARGSVPSALLSKLIANGILPTQESEDPSRIFRALVDAAEQACSKCNGVAHRK